MKYLLLIPDGMADWSYEELGNKTPLEYAEPENMNYLAKESICGIAKTIPDGFEPGSDIANMTILGVSPKKYYTGRGPLEALAKGVEGRIFFRCNLVYVENEKMIDYSGNRISDSEAKKAFEHLNRNSPYDFVKFYHGVSFRGILALRKEFENIPKTYPPHDIMGREISKYLPSGGELSKILIDLMEWSAEALEEINCSANMIWPWSGGRKPDMPKFRESYGLKAGMISEVDLLKGIGRAMEMDIIEVPGTTGYIDTNYRGLAKSAIKALKTQDFVVLHTEGIDEVSHEGDLERKIEAINLYDEKILGYILDRIDLEDVKIMLLPDHPTPVAMRTHVAEEVPVMIKNGRKDDVTVFSERTCKKGKLGNVDGLELMGIFLTI